MDVYKYNCSLRGWPLQVCDMAVGTVAAFDVGEDAPPGRPLQPLFPSVSPVAADAVRPLIQKRGRTLYWRCFIQWM